MAGTSSGEIMSRIIWRIESVETARPMPSRRATSRASELLPTPEVPPNNSTTGRSAA